MSEFSIAVADADQYRLMVAGVAISQGAGQSGYADGEFFTSDWADDLFKAVVGTDGSVARSKVNNRLINMTVSLLQTSSSNAYLSSLFNLDINQPNGAGIGSFVLQDLQGTTLILCTRAWISKPAPVSLDRAAKERKWNFQGIASTYVVGGN
jgi:hypothetical protein